MLAEQHVHERTGAVEGAIQVAAAPANFRLRLIEIPAATCLAVALAAEFLDQRGGELGLSLPHGLMAEHHAPDGKHLGLGAQA